MDMFLFLVFKYSILVGPDLKKKILISQAYCDSRCTTVYDKVLRKASFTFLLGKTQQVLFVRVLMLFIHTKCISVVDVEEETCSSTL